MALVAGVGCIVDWGRDTEFVLCVSLFFAGGLVCTCVYVCVCVYMHTHTHTTWGTVCEPRRRDRTTWRARKNPDGLEHSIHVDCIYVQSTYRGLT